MDIPGEPAPRVRGGGGGGGGHGDPPGRAESTLNRRGINRGEFDTLGPDPSAEGGPGGWAGLARERQFPASSALLLSFLGLDAGLGPGVRGSLEDGPEKGDEGASVSPIDGGGMEVVGEGVGFSLNGVSPPSSGYGGFEAGIEGLRV